MYFYLFKKVVLIFSRPCENTVELLRAGYADFKAVYQTILTYKFPKVNYYLIYFKTQGRLTTLIVLISLLKVAVNHQLIYPNP